MDKYAAILVSLTVATFVLMIGADLAYTKYRESGHRYVSAIKPSLSSTGAVDAVN